MAEYLSTSEVARYLKLNQKKVYALVAAGQLPGARISGKWLFPKELVDRWVSEHTVYPAGGLMAGLLDQLLVLQGSDDWLLSRVIDRLQLRYGTVATASVGSFAGVTALAAGNAHVASCHVDPALVRKKAMAPVYLFGLFAREQGILFDRGRRDGIEGLSAICQDGVRFARRQEQSGTFRLVQRLLGEERLQPRWTDVGPFSSHLELALDVRSGHADAGVGIRVAAQMVGLDFVPLAREPFYLVIPASFMSHKRLTQFLQLLVEELTAEARQEPPGYSFEALGRVQPLVPAPPTQPDEISPGRKEPEE